MLTNLEILFFKLSRFHLETLLRQLLTTQQPYKGAGKCLGTTSLCCGMVCFLTQYLADGVSCPSP